MQGWGSPLTSCEENISPSLRQQDDFQPEQIPEQNVPKPSRLWQTLKYVANRFSLASSQTESLRCFQFSCSSLEGKVRVIVCHHSFADLSTPEVEAEWAHAFLSVNVGISG